MAEDTGGEKTLPASGQKLQKARQDGNLAKSQDLNAGLALMVALLAMLILGEGILAMLLDAGRYYFSNLHQLAQDPSTLQSIAIGALYFVGASTLPFMVTMVIFGLSFNILQVGFMYTTKPMQPKLNRIDPIAGTKRYFSLRTFIELLKSLLKLGVAGTIVWLTMRTRTNELLSLMGMTPWGLLPAIAGLVITIWWRIALVMILIGIVDYGYQRWQHAQDMKMTQNEAKQESKELEGDPQVKRRVRQIQRQLATQRMMTDVPEADVVITNPTHYAIAIRYAHEEMTTPVVVAKGMRLVAQQIRELAIENDVPIVQRPELARALYKGVEIGQPISEELFRAVAEVLSFVYSIDRRTAKVRERKGVVTPPGMTAVAT
jgi:flagellar biosynthetic protein FlhB